ncbi:hypothetical protein N8I74_00255 [Chitiniphilus purpureus]|uniref:Uncharacterized protein n=1 Tax=Chitiniphilus purpureus TaxID=2981137 RepID=A0ABY6DMP7_9NEIS|nr:hypothetical protein [Chitiniphilus sp. CD1]UXY15483.1 hypothetical protein N8I74_00255 [Chitiniphilus sp. CD1]
MKLLDGAPVADLVHSNPMLQQRVEASMTWFIEGATRSSDLYDLLVGLEIADHTCIVVDSAGQESDHATRVGIRVAISKQIIFVLCMKSMLSDLLA